MDLMDAIATGDFQAVIDGLPGDKFTDTVDCPCGKANTFTIARVGCVLVTYTDAGTNHGNPIDDDFMVISYRSEAGAIERYQRFVDEAAQFKATVATMVAVGAEHVL